jgi:glycosyltransferase involved in cell wall biosynthesis
VVVDGDTGHLVPTGNPAATADALLELLGDRRAAREMGEAGFRRFQDRFSVERMIPRYEDFYQRLYDGSNIRV